MGKGSGCCEKESILPEKYAEDRKCTDILFLILFILFWIGFIVVASIGFANGDPDRLLYGTDYLGYVCGKGDGPKGFTGTSTVWQSEKWSKNDKLWYPIPANGSINSISDILDNGVCVESCPVLDNETRSALEEVNMNFYSLNETMIQRVQVYTYGYETHLGEFSYAPDYYWVPYSGKDFYRRCLPDGLQPSSINSTLHSIPGASGTSNFFFRGFLEIASSWRVILIISFVALFLCYIYVFVMRFIVRPLVYSVLLLVLIAICLLGYVLYHRSEALKTELENMDPKDSDMEDYQKAYEYCAYITWAIAAIYVILVIWFWKRIKEACAMIEIAGRVVASSPLMLLIPPIVAIGVLILALWCIYVAVYLYTADNYEKGREKLIPIDVNTTVPGGVGVVTINNQTYANTTGGFLDSDNAKRNLLFYNLFGFLWTMGFINAIGFTLIAFCGVFWYYSSLDDAEKHIPAGSICKATVWCLFYHLGTLALGSLLVAIVQMMRFMLKYVAKQCEAIGKSDVLKCIICIADCCLACFERVIKIISKNAYIMMCITSDNFFFSARDAFNIILDNVVTITILTFIVEFVMLLGKILIIIACVMISYTMMDDETLAPNVETRIMPLILIALIVYFICCIFFNVYSTTVDTVFICYHHDLKVNASKGIYYVPKELEEQISNYNAKQAKLNLDRNVAAEAKGSDPAPNKPANEPTS